MVRRVRADRERQPMTIHNRHDFHAFSALRWSDFRPATFGHNERRIDEAFFFIQRAVFTKLVGNVRQTKQKKTEIQCAKSHLTSVAKSHLKTRFSRRPKATTGTGKKPPLSISRGGAATSTGRRESPRRSRASCWSRPERRQSIERPALRNCMAERKWCI